MKPSLVSITFVIFTATLMCGCKHKADTPTVAPPVKVDIMVVNDSARISSTVYSGTVVAANSTTVSFSVPGTIDKLYVEEGQRVAKGQMLGKLKGGDYQNALNIANAQLAEAEDAYARLKKLHDANALPEIKWVEMEQKLKQARNAADIASRALDETMLRSPLSGVVSRKIADQGQNVAPIQPVYEIVTTDKLNVEISIPENEIGRIAVGQKARVNVGDGQPVETKVSQKSVVADPLTRTYKVKIDLPSGVGQLLPGMVVNVSLVSDGETTTIVVPSQAVNLGNDNQTYVWVVRDGRAERRKVMCDELAVGGVVVNTGLEPGDSVIVSGMQKVGSGSLVSVTE